MKRAKEQMEFMLTDGTAGCHGYTMIINPLFRVENEKSAVNLRHRHCLQGQFHIFRCSLITVFSVLFSSRKYPFSPQKG